MGRGPKNGGVVASRGFIFQTIVAEIQCLERNDWDAIKVEPKTENDKVDIMLFRDGKKISAIQVKSSIHPISDTKVKEWLEKLRADADTESVGEICLYLVGDSFKPTCEDLIKGNSREISKVSFKNIQNVCIEALIKYIRSKGADWDVGMDEYEFISDALFSKIFKNSISQEPVSRDEFERRFQRALPVHIIPKCLTSVPAVNHTVGLVGRSEIKKTIRAMLEKNGSMALVNGLGGIGKTAVMLYVCNDIKDEGKYVAWIECGGSLKEELLLLRTSLGIPESDNAETAYAKIIRELKANRQLAGNLYLFLDNLSRVLSDEEQETLAGLNIHVMATSRFEHDYFVNLPLDVLEETAALDMFYRYYLQRHSNKTRRFIDAAREIIESVQSHTLLVELFAKAAAKKGGTLEDFRDNLREQGVFDVFKRKLSTKHDRNRTIEECVMELYKTSNLTPAQQHIMKLFTIFTPEKEIYYKIAEWADLDMDAIDALVELGWLEQGGLENGYQIHQIVRDSLARQMKRDGEEVRLEDYGDLIDKVIKTNSYVGKEITYEKVRERLVLTEDVAGFFEEKGREDAFAGDLFNNIGGVYSEQGYFGKALDYFNQARKIREKVLRKGDPNTAITYNNMATMYRNLGNYEKSLEYINQTRKISEEGLGRLADYFPTSASEFSTIAAVYMDQGNYEKALEYYEKAQFICEKLFGMNHPNTATTYNNIASVCRKQGNYRKALEYYERALVVQEEVLGKDHPSTASMYNNIALVYAEQSDYEKALEYYEKARIIQEKMLGANHPDTAMTYNNMATLYANQGDYKKALEYHEKVRVIREEVLGAGHPDMAMTYNNVAAVYTRQGNYENALEYYKKALVIREEVLGASHPDTATTYNNMAFLYNKQRNYERALEYYKKAMTIQEKALGSEHPNTATTYSNMADVYSNQRKCDKAVEYYKKALKTREIVLGTDHLTTATTYSNLAYVYYNQGNYDKALECYDKAMIILQKVRGINHPDTAKIYNNIAYVYCDQGNYDKALEYSKKAHKVFTSVFGEDNQYTKSAVQGMSMVVEILLNTGMNEDEIIEKIKNTPT